MMRLERVLERLRQRIDGAIMRAAVERVNDGMKTQRVKLTVMAEEGADNIEHLQPYGVSFVPPVGSEALVLTIGGDQGHAVALVSGRPGERPTGAASGTGGLYLMGEYRVYLAADGAVHLGAKQGAARIARADRVDAEFARIWNMLANWAPAGTLGDATALKTLVSSTRPGVAGTGCDKVRGT